MLGRQVVDTFKEAITKLLINFCIFIDLPMYTNICRCIILFVFVKNNRCLFVCYLKKKYLIT